jgi:hypothetical protein
MGNIKCGNSLIETDFYVQPDLELTDDKQNKVKFLIGMGRTDL